MFTLLRLSMLGFLTVSFCQVGCAQPVRVGGYSAANVDAPSVVEAARFAVQSYAEQTGQDCQLMKITRAHTQIVAGVNFKLTMQVSEQGQSKTVAAVVYRKLDGVFDLTSWSPPGTKLGSSLNSWVGNRESGDNRAWKKSGGDRWGEYDHNGWKQNWTEMFRDFNSVTLLDQKRGYLLRLTYKEALINKGASGEFEKLIEGGWARVPAGFVKQALIDSTPRSRRAKTLRFRR